MRRPADPIPPAAAGALSRRSFLVFTTAVSALTVTGCGLFGEDGDGPVADSDVPFGVWQQLRASVRESPDHVAAAAERVVAQPGPGGHPRVRPGSDRRVPVRGPAEPP
nr:hypothetical protein GCM10020092_077900 [Actinoplanes digitatis]